MVAATNRDLKALYAHNCFRRDLYERLTVFPIAIPALRERREDITLFAEYFRAVFVARLQKAVALLGQPVLAPLGAYGFPGNVRELRSIIERAVIMTETGAIVPRHLPPRVLGEETSARLATDFVPGVDTLGALEQRMIREAMTRAGNVLTPAARMLGISRYLLLRRMEKYGIRPEGEEE